MCQNSIAITTPVGCTTCNQSVVTPVGCINPIDYLFEQAVPIAEAGSIHIVDAVIDILEAGLVVTEKEDFCLLDNTANYSFYAFTKVAGLTTVVNYMRSTSGTPTCPIPACVGFHGSLLADGLYNTLFPNKPKVCDIDFASQVSAFMNEINNNLTVLNLGICEVNSINQTSSLSRIIANIKAIDTEITLATLTTKLTDLLNAGLYYKPSPTGHVFGTATSFTSWLDRYSYNDMCV